jgi:hypothetical protein
MRLLIVTAAAAALFLSPAFASGTGIGKGTPGTVTTPNPCTQGDTYDPAKDLCTRPDGTTYKPAPH